MLPAPERKPGESTLESNFVTSLSPPAQPTVTYRGVSRGARHWWPGPFGGTSFGYFSSAEERKVSFLASPLRGGRSAAGTRAEARQIDAGDIFVYLPGSGATNLDSTGRVSRGNPTFVVGFPLAAFLLVTFLSLVKEK